MSTLPTGWVETTIGKVADIKLGKMLDNAKNKGLPRGYLRNINVRWGTFDLRDIQEMRFTEDEIEAFGIRNGDVIVCEGGEPGRCAVWQSGDTTLQFQKALMRLRPLAGVNPFFVSSTIRFLSKSDRLRRHFTGTTIKHLPQSSLAAVPIALPPLGEQTRIVAKLDALSAKSARARTELTRIEALVSRYKQAVLSEAFNGKLTADWRAIHPSTALGDVAYSIAQERAASRKERGLTGGGNNRSVPQNFIALENIPNEWSWLDFDRCSYDLTVGHVGPMKDQYVASGIPFLRSLNIKPNKITTEKLKYIDHAFHAKLRKSKLNSGDLVVVRTGEPGIAAVVPDSMRDANCSDLVICRLVPSVEPRYAAFYMNSSLARSAVGDMQVGVAQQHFNVGAMSKMPIPIPPFDEQREIVRRIESAFTRIDRLAAEAKRALDLLGKLDEAILAKAFRGELVPQDENDEPADVLLERIRAKRAATPKSKRVRARA